MIGIRRAPLDAITQEIVISLRDEADRWEERDIPEVPRVRSLCLQRDDGLVIYERVSLGWAARAVSVWAGDGHVYPKGPEARAIFKAQDAYKAHREATSADRVKAYLSRVR